MADEAELKHYTSKINIGGVIYYLKDTESRNALTLLNNNKDTEGSVLNSIKIYAEDADYTKGVEGSETTLGEAIKSLQDKVAVLRADLKTEGSVDYKIYYDSKDAVYSVEKVSVERNATQDDVDAGLATIVGEKITIQENKVVTIAEAIEAAANSIGSLTINGIAPDENMAVVLKAGNIDRDDESKTIEESFTSLEGRMDDVEYRLDVLEGPVTEEGSVLKTVKDTSVNATYTEATEAVGEEGSEDYVPAKPRVTLGEAIKANTDAIDAEKTRATTTEKGITDRLDIIEGDDSVANSIKNLIKTLSVDASFTFTGADSATTIGDAIQANADAIVANKTGSFKVVDSTSDIELSDDGLGIIYLVMHDPTEKNDADKSVATHYDEYIVIKVGEDYKFEKIGDTEITLEGYSTQTWVLGSEGARKAVFSPEYTRKATAEEVSAGTYESVDVDVTVPAVTIQEAIEALQNKVKEGTEQLRADLNAEIERATSAEEALDERVSANEDAIETLNGDVEVEGSVANSIREQAKDATYIEATEDTEKVTIAQAIAANTKAIEDEETRAKAAEKANADEIESLDERVDELEEKVKVKTVVSVNGVAASDENGGKVVIVANDIDYKLATTGSGTVGEEDYVAPTEAVTIKDALDDHGDRLDSIEEKTITQTINDISTTVTGTFKTGITLTTKLSAKDIPMDKDVEGSISIFERIENIESSTTSALTSVSIKTGTGTWKLSTDDNEMLVWTDPELETDDATFLVPLQQ